MKNNRAVILHIAAITNDLFSGVNVVVPQHIQFQSHYAEVGLLNILDVNIPSIETQFQMSRSFALEDLSEPFNHPDIVVFHEIYRSDYLKISKELIRNKVPYIIFPHGSLTKKAQQKKWFKKKIANILLFNRFINGASATQFLSEKEKSETSMGSKNKFIITNGMNIPDKMKVHDKLTFSSGIIMSYIGRLDAYHKGLDLMIEAIKIKAFFLRSNNVKVNIYGPDYRNRAKNLIKLVEEAGVTDIIELHDAVSGIDKENVLLESDIFVQTSRFEGMPMGILEALSYGLPCLVTEGTTIGEKIINSNAGWMAKNTSVDIAEVFEQAINERSLYQEKGKKARSLIKNSFNWDKIAKDTINCYKTYF
ncbi:glycosyltransferase family 4 protein [Streptococcus suis]|uniref:Glycosyltransferase n=4 Tax=Streptococcus suis TaxID=1307 RepID=A0A0F6UW05_STRSU|nr:glycosyltransferase family 4 protein [Streptococcus suis]AKE79560.1 glycosyltransferase [Streptococcus suis]AKE80033.1 glycosyltransferase [Streptococcus suis]AKE80054.1 glycosyltransferase [Streptococcus suis]AKE80095.1 glycosyltransferase [Streptococcus suis]AKE80378.1 glycosyltransferase [Streptococcus suis]